MLTVNFFFDINIIFIFLNKKLSKSPYENIDQKIFRENLRLLNAFTIIVD